MNNNINVGVAADAEEDGENHFPHPWKCSRTRRCKACLRGVQGEGYTAARNSMKIQAQQCQHCAEAVCKILQVPPNSQSKMIEMEMMIMTLNKLITFLENGFILMAVTQNKKILSVKNSFISVVCT